MILRFATRNCANVGSRSTSISHVQTSNIHESSTATNKSEHVTSHGTSQVLQQAGRHQGLAKNIETLTLPPREHQHIMRRPKGGCGENFKNYYYALAASSIRLVAEKSARDRKRQTDRRAQHSLVPFSLPHNHATQDLPTIPRDSASIYLRLTQSWSKSLECGQHSKCMFLFHRPYLLRSCRNTHHSAPGGKYDTSKEHGIYTSATVHHNNHLSLEVLALLPTPAFSHVIFQMRCAVYFFRIVELVMALQHSNVVACM